MKIRILWLAFEHLRGFAENDREYRNCYKYEAKEIYGKLSDKKKDKLYKKYNINDAWFDYHF